MQKIRAQICSILELFTLRYADVFTGTYLTPFVQSVWEFLADPRMASSETTREDVLVCRALGFLGVVVRKNDHSAMFEQQGTLERFLEMIVLPNMQLRSQYNPSCGPAKT